MESLMLLLVAFGLIGGVFVWTSRQAGEADWEQRIESPKAYMGAVLLGYSMVLIVFLYGSYSEARGYADLKDMGGAAPSGELPMDIWRVGCVLVLVIGTGLGWALHGLQMASFKRHGWAGMENAPGKLLVHLGWSARMSKSLGVLFFWLPVAVILTGSLIVFFILPALGGPVDVETLSNTQFNALINAQISHMRDGMLVSEVFVLYLAAIMLVPLMVGQTLTIWRLSHKGRDVIQTES